MKMTKTEILPAVAAIIFDTEGNILLQKRRDVGLWGLPSGHVEFGETVEQAIIREVKEETGANAKVKRLIGVYSDPKFQTYDYEDRKVHYITTFMEVELQENFDAHFQNDETQALGFFAETDLPTDMAMTHPKWLTDTINHSFSGSIR